MFLLRVVVMVSKAAPIPLAWTSLFLSIDFVLTLFFIRVALTADEYQLTMQSLTAKDDGKKLSCVYDNGEEGATVKTFRLRLKVMTTTPPPPPEPTEPAVVVDEVVTEASKPVPTKAGRVDTKDSDSKTQVDKKTTDLSGKEGGGGGGGGAPSLTTSSGLAAILITLYALQL